MSVYAGFIASSLPGTPGTPVLVSASSLPMIQITWTAPQSNGGSAIQSYNIYENGVLAASVPPTSLSYTETSAITTGQTYLFQVTAVNAIGEGTISSGISVMAAQVPSQPAAPTKVAASPVFV